MPERRQNFFTKDWVIIALEWAKHSKELATRRLVQPVPSFVEKWPFCSGNGSKTPPAVLPSPAIAGEPWAVRVIPTSFPALSSEVEPRRNLQPSFGDVSGMEFADLARVLP